MSRASTSYKKKDGTLSVSDDKKYLFWTAASPPGASPSLTVPVGDIANLQQTPATSPKIALKVVVQASSSAEPENHVFSFTSGSARADQEAITETLRNALSAIKSSTKLPVAQPPSGDETGQSAAMAIAHAVSSRAAKATETWYDDARLKNDIDLQRSLLEANPVLKQRFNESLRDKPESITITQFSMQFWSTRLHLLRAHAIEKAQSQGDYNVLPEIKFKRIASEKEGEPDKLMLNLAKEQVKLIFKQYPVVREAYNDNVPKLDQNQFWSRFFMSRLLKRLKGEKITDSDAADPIFDKYLDFREKGPASIQQVPHFIDLEGNEQNHSQRQGNRPDETMRPGSYDKVPILRVLNSLSEKMMAHVSPSDDDPLVAGAMDQKTYDELQLRDLRGDAEDNRVFLNIKDQQKLHGEHGSQVSADAILYAKHAPSKVLDGLRRGLQVGSLGEDSSGSLRLDQVIGAQSDSDSSDEEMDGQAEGNAVNGRRAVRIGSSTARDGTTKDLMKMIKSARTTMSGDASGTCGLSQQTFDNLTMTHNTTIEFIHYFWTLFLSGDGSRVGELAKLVETLDKSLDRITAVASAAEDERQRKTQSLTTAIQSSNPRSNKRRRLELELASIGGGRKVVDEIVAPTIHALATATNTYKKAFEEQSKLASAEG